MVDGYHNYDLVGANAHDYDVAEGCIPQKDMYLNDDIKKNKLASLEATLVQNSAHSLTYSLKGVKCRATSVAKKN